MSGWAWPKYPFGENSDSGCHDAFALRPFPEGSLNLETDIRWNPGARREPGTVFGVLRHRANTNQKAFGIGRRYYLPSDADAHQVACLNLPNTPCPENPNWPAVLVRLRESGHTEVARLTPPEILAMLATGPAPGDSPAAGAPRPKRSTERGEARLKLIAALTKHHRYADGSCLNLDPIGNNELAKAAGVSPSTAFTFFRDKFKGHTIYKAHCRDAGRLVASLKLLNNEFSPHNLYGGRPADEGDEDNLK